MTHTASSLVEESNRLFQHTWTYFAKHLPGGGTTRLPGLLLANGRSPLLFMNAALVTGPLMDEADLRERIEVAGSHFRRHELHWILGVSDHFVPETLRDRLAEICISAGLQYMMPLYGMAADTLAKTQRPLPAIELQVVDGATLREAVGDLNGAGYGIPGEVCRSVTCAPDIWQDMLGVVGFDAGVPAACACVAAIDNIAYVALVATAPAHQHKGYAEAVMRRALAEARTEWGVQRTVLHATPAGQSVYRRMGYADTVRFEAFTGA